MYFAVDNLFRYISLLKERGNIRKKYKEREIASFVNTIVSWREKKTIAKSILYWLHFVYENALNRNTIPLATFYIVFLFSIRLFFS